MCDHIKFPQIEYPEIEEGTKPRHRFMSAYEQRVETADKNYQYLLFAAEPYEVIVRGVVKVAVVGALVFCVQVFHSLCV